MTTVHIRVTKANGELIECDSFTFRLAMQKLNRRTTEFWGVALASDERSAFEQMLAHGWTFTTWMTS